MFDLVLIVGHGKHSFGESVLGKTVLKTLQDIGGGVLQATTNPHRPGRFFIPAACLQSYFGTDDNLIWHIHLVVLDKIVIDWLLCFHHVLECSHKCCSTVVLWMLTIEYVMFVFPSMYIYVERNFSIFNQQFYYLHSFVSSNHVPRIQIARR